MDSNISGTLKRRAQGVSKPGPGLKPNLDSARHQRQRPTIWPSSVLLMVCLLAGVVTFGVLWAARRSRGLGEEVPHNALCPWNKLDKAVTAVTVETGLNGKPDRLLVTDEKTFHCGKAIKDLYYWQRRPVQWLCPWETEPTVVGLSARESRVAVTYEDKNNPRRGLTMATLPETLGKMTVWSHPAIDTSYFPGIDDEIASCVAFDPNSGRRFIGGMGVGCYDISKRRWDDILTNESGDIDSSVVNDIEFVGHDGAVIAGDGGLTIGQMTEGKWSKTRHLNRASGLAGDNMMRASVTSRARRISKADIMYQTMRQGLGRFQIGYDDGSVDGLQTLIGEGRAYGLSKESLKRLDRDPIHEALWMVYESPKTPGQHSAALYRVPSHEMSGLPNSLTWTGPDAFTLAADPYEQIPTAWVGSKGLRRIYAKTRDSLGTAQAGLADVSVQEVVPTPSGLYARGNSSESSSPVCIHAAARTDQDDPASPSWHHYVGPRRFPGLELADITSATQGVFDDQPALFVGTRDKGIGVFTHNSRELFQAFDLQALEPGQRASMKGSLDLCALGSGLVQVGSDRSLHFYNGNAWATVIPQGGIQIDSDRITAMAAQGTHLVIGSEDVIGHYNAGTHNWRSMPPVPGLQHLMVAIDRLWAIDRNRTLFSCSLASAIPETFSPGQGGQQSVWIEEEKSVVDMYGDNTKIVVIAKDAQSHRLWIQTRGQDQKREVVETTSLPGRQNQWTAAAVEGTTLYVAPHGRGIGQYDLSTHQWNALSVPDRSGSSVQNLLATDAGLWLLDNQRSLFFMEKGSEQWALATDHVERVNSNGKTVIALSSSGNVLLCDLTSGGLPMHTLVGDAFEGSLSDVRAGSMFGNWLFVATPRRVGRYEVNTHTWHTYSTDRISDVAEFAYSSANLYARSQTGDVWRWIQQDNTWDKATDGDGQPLRSLQIAGNGGSMIAIRAMDGKVWAAFDSGADQPVMLLAANRCPARAPFTAAAEMEKDLIIASADGQIAAYTKMGQRPYQWHSVLGAGSDGQPIEQLLVPPGSTDCIVAVGRKRASLIVQGSSDKNWRLSNDLVNVPGITRGSVSDSDFYALCENASGETSIVKVPLAEVQGASNSISSREVTIIGDAFPSGSNLSTVAIGKDADGTLFRADQSGTVASYSLTSHRWKLEPIKDVTQFLRLEDQLWAWCGGEGTLHQRLGQAWQKDDRSWSHVVGDGHVLVLADSTGALVHRTTQGDHMIIPSVSQPLPAKSIDEIVAIAEHGEWLFLSGKNGPPFAYHRPTHTWKIYESTGHIVRFEKLKGNEAALFGLTDQGELLLHRVPDAWDRPLPDQTRVKALVPMGNDRLAVVTQLGHIVLLGPDGQRVADYRPRKAEGMSAGGFNIMAAAECNNRLLIVPSSGSNRGSLWMYDPQQHTWKSRQVDGTDVRFYRLSQGLWLTTRQTNNTLTLMGVNADDDIELGPTIQDLRDVASDGKSLFAVTQEGRVRQVDTNGQLRSLGLTESELPEGRNIHAVIGVADACVVLLDDGSVNHYTIETRRWVQKIPPTESSSPGMLLNISEGRAVVLVRPDGSVWLCNVTNAEWTKLDPGTDIASLDLALQDQARSQWTVASKTPDYQLSVTHAKRELSMSLRDRRFDLDRAELVAFNPAGELLVKTPVAVRTFVPQERNWQEKPDLTTEFTHSKPDPVAFTGKVFDVKLESNGAFTTTHGKATITMSVDDRKALLAPAADNEGFGFAHDSIHDLAATSKSLYLATTGGMVELILERQILTMRRIDDITCGLTDLDLGRICLEQNRLLTQSAKGTYYTRAVQETRWNPIDSGEANRAFERTSAVTGYNAMLTNWRIAQNGTQVWLEWITPKGAVPVSFSQSGLGIDHPQAFGVADDSLRLYTPDGLVEAKCNGEQLEVDLIDSRYTLPSFGGFAYVLESGQGGSSQQTWIRSILTPAQAWRFDDRRWITVQDNEYETELARQKPYYWDSPGVRWDRKDQLHLENAGSNKTVTTQFDSVQRRFEVDIPYDIAVFENALWAATQGGMVRFASDGQWDHITAPLSGNNLPSLRVVTLDGQTHLVLQRDNRLVQWDGSQWRSPLNLAKLSEVIKQLDTHLIYGHTWRITRSDAGSSLVPMQACIGPTQTFTKVILNEDGLFNFERVNSILIEGETCHVAADYGLIQLNAHTRDFDTVTPQTIPATQLGRLDSQIYAMLASGEVLQLSEQWRPYQAGANMFTRIAQSIINQSYWQWDRPGNQLRIQLHPGDESIWAGTGTLPVTTIQGRFDFDVVHDVGYAESPWLITDKGLLPREGADLRQIGAVESADIISSPRQAKFASIVHNDRPALFLTTPRGMYQAVGKNWQSVPSADRTEIQMIMATQVTKGTHFDVRRLSGGVLDTFVRIDALKDPYKRVAFNDEQGRFAFDVLEGLAQYAHDVNGIAIVGTAGGAAIYDIDGTRSSSQGGAGPLRHLYCDPKLDGIGSVPIEDVVYARKAHANFLLSSGRKLYCLKGDGQRPDSFGRWEAATSSDEEVFEENLQILADNSSGWHIRDRQLARQNKPNFGEARFETHWRDQAVRLVDLRQTRDASESICRFAHDIPLSATLLENMLWVGTRGGVVLFAMRTSDTVDPTEFVIRGEQTLPEAEWRGNRQLTGIGFIRAAYNEPWIYARREGDQTVLRSSTDTEGSVWETVPADHLGFQAACKVAVNPVWTWHKDSLKSVELRPNRDRLRLPDDYCFLAEGTWAFLQLDHAVPRDPRHTMVFFEDSLYVGTAGGVTRFPAGILDLVTSPATKRDDVDFVSHVYAVTQGPRGTEPMLDVVELYVDLNQRRLYAKTRRGSCHVFDSNQDTWSVYDKSDQPMDRALVLVDNDLLRCRSTNEGVPTMEVVPLDLADQSRYPLFQNGRFVFDEVRAYTDQGDYLWLATDGAVCLYSYAEFKPIRFFAETFCRNDQNAQNSPPKNLTLAREVIYDPLQPSRVLCRTASDETYEYTGKTWTSCQDMAAFLRAYTRGEDSLGRWLEYPDRTLEVHVRTGNEQMMTLGTKGGKGGKTNLSLFRNNRFSFDDVHDAVLHGSILLTATPVGVVEQSIDWSGQNTPINKLYCRATGGDSIRDMNDLERIVEYHNGEIHAWGKEVFSTFLPRHPGQALQWQASGQNGESLTSHRILPDIKGLWELVAYNETGAMQVAHVGTGRMHKVARRFRCRDVSYAVFDDRWIYVPRPADKGGLLRIRKNDVF